MQVFLRRFGSLSESKNTPTRTPTNLLGRAASYFIAKLVDRALGSQEKHRDFQTFCYLLGRASIIAHLST